jgi:hypothetical protein
MAVCNTQKDTFLFYYYLLYFFCFFESHVGQKKTIFLEIKTTKNKPKGCLPNTPLNQRKLNKKKKNQTKQGLRTDSILT